MKNYALAIKTYDGQIGYATTDYLATITRDVKRAKRFTLNKATKILSKPQAKGYYIIELGE